jgi:hypothetical protein
MSRIKEDILNIKEITKKKNKSFNCCFSKIRRNKKKIPYLTYIILHVNFLLITFLIL